MKLRIANLILLVGIVTTEVWLMHSYQDFYRRQR
jgi:hypothetical protein